MALIYKIILSLEFCSSQKMII